MLGGNVRLPSKNVMAHSVIFYVAPGFQLMDLAGPLDALQLANLASGRDLYRWTVVSRSGGMVVGGTGLPIQTSKLGCQALDTLILIGGDLTPMLHSLEIETVKNLVPEATRTASICTGAFLLASTGMLDGRRVTTHWSRASQLQKAYPKIAVEADRIFIADGPFWTSAGISAGVDLALALIDTDYGIDLARKVARELVVYHRRPGGQSQYSALSQMEPASDRIRVVLNFARENLAHPLSVSRLAEVACLSPRQFERVFRRETGETPAKAVERLRVEEACTRLQNGFEHVEQIARAVGFTDPERMRRAFIKRYGHPPQAVRRLARSDSS